MARIPMAVLVAVAMVPRLASQCDIAQLLGPADDPDSRMGAVVALSADTLAVGLPNADAYATSSGEVRIYRQIGSSWLLVQSLGSGAALNAGDRFGTSVSAEGPYLAIGADGVDGQSSDEGAVFLFKNENGLYTLKWTFVAPWPYATPGQAFGGSVSVSAGWLIVGASRSDLAGDDAGAAFVFREDLGWYDVAVLYDLLASPGDLFGASVSTKNGIFAVGVPQDDLGGQDSGSVRVYYLNGAAFDEYNLDELHAPPPGQPGAHFGSAVAVSDTAVAVAAALEDAGAPDSGAVHLFRMEASTDQVGVVSKGWFLDQSLSPASPQPFVQFGSAIALDDSTLVVGSRFEDTFAKSDTGALDVYRRAGPAWEHRTHLAPVQASPADYTGWSVAASGALIAAGAPGDDVSGASDAGSVTLWSMTACPGLFASLTTTTQSLPQPVQFSLNAGVSFASRPYAILGSVTGTSPGFPLHGAHVPLNLDAYSSFTATPHGFMPGFWGVLDGTGKSTATLPLPIYLPPAMLDLTLHHAFIAKGTSGTSWYASNAEPLAFIKVWPEPWPHAGPDLSIGEESYGGGALVGFAGYNSTSPNGWIEQWHWDFGDGTTGTGVEALHQYVMGGDYVATLTVIDNVGAAGQDTRAVHINKMPLGIIELLTPNPTVGQPVSFSSAQSFDPDGSIASFEWSFDGVAVSKPASEPIAEWTFLWSDTFKVSMTAIDDDGLAGSNIAEIFVFVAP